MLLPGVMFMRADQLATAATVLAFSAFILLITNLFVATKSAKASMFSDQARAMNGLAIRRAPAERISSVAEY